MSACGHRPRRFDRRLEVIENDLKDFYKLNAGQTTDITRLKDKTGMDK